ncbi:MAG: cation transporter [Fidelibacterota bacterium]|nr:MAG: cation transporter [Candidatus Neomarinimicrobiota bacterium]
MPNDRMSPRRALWWAFGLNFGFMLVELAGGLLTGSMALVSDAGHMLTDTGAIGLALFASWLAARPNDPQRTYGYLRAEILGALANGVALILLCGYILVEAYQRAGHPQQIPGGPVLVIATVGLIINLGSALIMHRGRKTNLNLEGAYLHMISDALGSVGAMVAGGVILLTGWTPVDTLVSILIAVLILRGGWKLLMKAIDILMEGTPSEIDYHQIQEALKSREHIIDLHDLHIWSISSGVLALSAHLQLTDECVQSGHWSDCLRETQDYLRQEWGIEHTTLQTEPPHFQRTR